MTRLLLTAAAAMTMAVSSHANAASYVIDDFSDMAMFASAETNTVQATDAAGTYGRILSYDSTGDGGSVFLGGGALFLGHGVGSNGTVSLSYDLSSLTSSISGQTATVGFSVLSSDADETTPITVTAFLNGSQVGSWQSLSLVSDTPVLGSISFNTGTPNALRFEISGSEGYDFAMAAPLTLDVLPVPEPGEWAMLGAGLAVAGFAARRRRALAA